MQNSRMRPTFVVIASLLAASQAGAANRCVDSTGKVTYQDVPCPLAIAASEVKTTGAISTTPSSNGAPAQSALQATAAYTTAKGEWRGPAQFQLVANGVRDQGAQSVTPIVMELKPSGEVVGVMSEAGCKLSGLATQFVTPQAASVDVTFKDCRDKRFNVRFSGYLMVNATAKEAKLSLNAIGRDLPSPNFRQASVDAVLRR